MTTLEMDPIMPNRNTPDVRHTVFSLVSLVLAVVLSSCAAFSPGNAEAIEARKLNRQWDSVYCARLDYSKLDSQEIKKILIPDSLSLFFESDSFRIQVNYFAAVAIAQKRIACTDVDDDNQARVVLRDLLQLKDAREKVLAMKRDLLGGRLDRSEGSVLWFTMLENGACVTARYGPKKCLDACLRQKLYRIVETSNSGTVDSELLIQGRPILRMVEGWVD